MPCRTGLSGVVDAPAQGVTSGDWQRALPALGRGRIKLREMRTSDAASLCVLLTTEEVTRFISPPPTTVEGFKQFIEWTHRQRSAGTCACFAVTLDGHNTAIGVFQIRGTKPGFGTAEWGFALGSPFWGTGVFQDAAGLVIEFAFEILGTDRLEARAAVKNGRGNGALLKVGAVQECILQSSCSRNGEYFDQVLYAILQDDWRASREAAPRVLHARVH